MNQRRFLYIVFALFFSLSFLVFSPVFALTRSITFPVGGPASFRNDFSEPRGGGTREHLGVDIIAPKMTPVLAAVDGTVTYAPTTQPSWGYSITIRDSEGYQYRYLHLNNDTPGTDDGLGGSANAYVAGIKRGGRVTAGQHIAWVGDSGNAEATVSHLHFEIRDPKRVPINPYESLVAAAAKSPFSNSINTGSAVVLEHPSEGDAGVAEGDILPTDELREGMRGELVRQLQTRLKELGYFTSSITDYFGPITKAAVVAFQNASGIDPIGIVGPKTRAALALNPTSPNTQPAAPYIFTQDLSQGASGEAVRQLQIKLQTLGYFTVSPTGYFGPITKVAVVNFQGGHAIEPIGIVGPKTRAALNQI